MSKELVFYTNPMSRGRIVRWMLEEINTPYKTVLLEYGTSMKAPEYLDINPMGKVPAIKHGNIVVSECAAICVYLAEIYTEAKLMPLNDEEKSEYYRWLFFTAGPLEQALGFKNLNVSISEDNEGMLGCGNVEAAINTLAKAVDDNEYIAGSRFTAADVYVGSHIGWGMQIGSLEKRPEFINYWNRIKNREARLRAAKIDDELMKAK